MDLVILIVEYLFRLNFSNNIADKIKSILAKFAEDTKLRELKTLWKAELGSRLYLVSWRRQWEQNNVQVHEEKPYTKQGKPALQKPTKPGTAETAYKSWEDLEVKVNVG